MPSKDHNGILGRKNINKHAMLRSLGGGHIKTSTPGDGPLWQPTSALTLWTTYMKFWWTVPNKCPKNLIWTQKWSFFDEKGQKWIKQIWNQNFKFIYSLKTINSVHITKHDHRRSIHWKKLAKNLKKYHFVTTSNVFFTKRESKMGQIFLAESYIPFLFINEP